MDLNSTSSSMLSSTDMQLAIDKAISESDNIVSALEAVGAMYGIPSTNILIDDSLNNLKVVNDCVCAPSHITNVAGNKKAIMCAIGSVLDFISQRVDDKLDNYQLNNISKGKIDDSIRINANPSKGNAIARYEDSNGDEILVYDSGLVDTANTPEAYEKIKQLRQDMKIPEHDNIMNKASYFNDEDDISADTTSSTDDISDDSTTDVSDDIQESAMILDLIDHFNGTRYLGYDLLQEQGFDYIRPITSIVQESSSEKSNKNIISAEDIKYMKFDNTNIINAIKYFNEARAEQPYAKKGHFDIKKFINSENYNKAIDCLNKQFNAKINVRFAQPDRNVSQLYTSIWSDVRHNLTISKSKGFQLNGLPIDIFVIGKSIDEDAPDDISLFGQNVVSTFCHEIFHNIAAVLREKTTTTMQSLNLALMIASGQNNAKNRRIVISNYVNSLDEFNGKKLNRLTKRILVKNLVVITAVQHDQNALNELETTIRDSNGANANKDIDNLIKKYTKIIKRNKPSVKGYAIKGLLMATSIILFYFNPFAAAGIQSELFAGIAGLLGLTTAGQITNDISTMVLRRMYESSNHYEEFYCDMFAGMYKLPITFFIGTKREFTPNDVDKDHLNRLANVEKEFYSTLMASYPTMMERNYTGVRIAKNLLENGDDLDPSIKKYCQWIVDNFSSTLDTDIGEIYNQNTFDPKTADDLDTHLQQLIDKNSIVLSESFVTWIGDTSSVIMESDERVNDKGTPVPEKCPICGSKVGVYLKGEPVWLCTNKKCNKYFGTLPFQEGYEETSQPIITHKRRY